MNTCKLWKSKLTASVTIAASDKSSDKCYKYVANRFNDERGQCKVLRKEPCIDKNEEGLCSLKKDEYTDYPGYTEDTCRKSCSVDDNCFSFMYYDPSKKSPGNGMKEKDCRLISKKGVIGELKDSGSCNVKQQGYGSRYSFKDTEVA